MNTIEFFLLHHYRLYFGRGGIYECTEKLNEQQLRISISKINSIAWLLWHIARCEDLGVNKFVTSSTQVLDESDWQKRLNIYRHDIGTGMTSEEVEGFSGNINVTELFKYSNAVAKKTTKIVKNLNIKELNEMHEALYIRDILFNENKFTEKSIWVKNVYLNKTKGWFLGHLGLTHGKGHLGQIILIRKLLGLKPTR